MVEEFEDIDKLSATENGLSLLQLIEVLHLTFFLQYAASSTKSYSDVSHVSFAQYICNYNPKWVLFNPLFKSLLKKI